MSATTKVIRQARKNGCKIYTRKGWWCPNVAVYQWRRVYRRHNLCPKQKVDTLWCHITVTNPQGIRKDMKTLHSIGMDRFGSGVSYNFAIDMETGAIGLGQALDAAGTHTLNSKDISGYSYNQNYVSFAVAFIGMPGMKPSRKAIRAFGRLQAAMIQTGYLTKTHDFVPHRLVEYKECPTDNVVEDMPEIREYCEVVLKGK